MRIAAQIGAAYLLLLLSGALWRWIAVVETVPDLSTLIAAYLGLTAKGKLAPSLAGAIFIGYLADIMFGSPIGMMALASGVVCITCHLLQGRLLVQGWVYVMVFAGLNVILAGLCVLCIRMLGGILSDGLGGHLWQILSSAMLSGIIGPIVFRVCQLVDARFAHTPRERDAAAAGHW